MLIINVSFDGAAFGLCLMSPVMCSCSEAEHGYASVLPPLSPSLSDKRSKQKSKKIPAGGNR